MKTRVSPLPCTPSVQSWRRQILAQERRIDAAERRMQRRAEFAHRRAIAAAARWWDASRVRSAAAPAAWILLTCVMLVAGTGCFSERSFTVPDKELQQLALVQNATAPDTRQWLEQTSPVMTLCLAPDRRRTITCSTAFQGDGQPVDVGTFYRVNQDLLDSIFFNPNGIQETAQVSPSGKRGNQSSDWPGFVPLEIPMSDGLQLCAVIAPPIGWDAGDSYVIETHGLFCAQEGYDARNMSEALRRYGHHVVAIEMRDHGQTGRKNPGYPMTFGASEVRDLIEVARYLRTAHGARRVGLLSFSMTAQQAITAAWVDSEALERELAMNPALPILRGMPRPATQPAFDAIVAVCPPTNLLNYADSLDVKRYSMLESPVRAAFQERIASRLRAQGALPTYSMWQFARHELGRSEWADQYESSDAMIADLVSFIDFSGENWQRGARRLESVRCPLLIIATANDPLGSAQATVNLVSRVRNPNVGLLVLRRGGHTGLSAMSASYYYALVHGVFDPQTCPGPRAPTAPLVPAIATVN